MSQRQENVRYVVLKDGIGGAGGALLRKGRVVAGVEAGDVARYLARGSIREATADEAKLVQVTIVDAPTPGSTSIDSLMADRDRELQSVRGELREARHRVGHLEQQLELVETEADGRVKAIERENAGLTRKLEAAEAAKQRAASSSAVTSGLASVILAANVPDLERLVPTITERPVLEALLGAERAKGEAARKGVTGAIEKQITLVEAK